MYLNYRLDTNKNGGISIMKFYVKFIVLVMIITCICQVCLSESKEGFQLRSGIVFGDTMNEILQKETKLVRDNEDDVWFMGTVAGYPEVECRFYCDEVKDQLYAMCYSFAGDICDSAEKAREVYKKLYDSAVRQYGVPLKNKNGLTHVITGPAYSDLLNQYLYLAKLLDYRFDYDNYDEWVVDCDDYHVKIDLVSFYYKSNDGEYTRCIGLSYMKFTDSEYEAACENGVQKEKDSNAIIDNDI